MMSLKRNLWITQQKCKTVFNGLTIADRRTLAFQLAERNGILHPFNKKLKMAGHDWVRIRIRICVYLSVCQNATEHIVQWLNNNDTMRTTDLSYTHAVDYELACKGASFMKRSQLCLRSAEPTSMSRLSGFDRVQVTHFYNILKEDVSKARLSGSSNIQPWQVWHYCSTKSVESCCKKGLQTGRQSRQCRKRSHHDCRVLYECWWKFYSTNDDF